MDSSLQKIKLRKNKVNPFILKMQDNVKGGDKNKDTDAYLSQTVWNQRILNGPNKESLRQSSGLHMHM